MRKISLSVALIPVWVLIILLAVNVWVFKDDATSGSNQFALLVGGAIAAGIGLLYRVSFDSIIEHISDNIKSTVSAILILLFVGALAGTWTLSGIVPAMIYYGLQILNPSIFLAASLVISSIVSVATGSSWTTSATIGIALIGIGNSLGVSAAMTAGAVISGAYFGDKISPLSDTTNLAAAMAGTDLYTHIRYMLVTTGPSILISLLIFIIIGFNVEPKGIVDDEVVLELIRSKFNLSPWLFLVPVIVIFLILRKVSPLPSLMIGTLLGAVFSLIFQSDLLKEMTGNQALDFMSTYKLIMNSITSEIVIPVETVQLPSGQELNLQDLFIQGGMSGMLNTVFLIICAMVFGGAMEAIGALEKIAEFFLSLFNSVLGLFASTVATCLALNVTASDQYLAIVVPGKMFKNAYDKKGLTPENLSRTLEDSGTVTSVLIPWNTCGAYHSKVLLGQSGMVSYIPYTFFNLISPFMTLLVAAIGYKIKYLKEK
ncbi:MAG: Na+/H+ antiporter NhaC [Moheibacter sp.]